MFSILADSRGITARRAFLAERTEGAPVAVE
jgi:hypothetical protein